MLLVEVNMTRKFFFVLLAVSMSLSAYSSTVGTWAKVFGKSGNDVFTNAVVLDDGGFILTGYTTSRENEENTWIMNIDRSGAIRWEYVLDLGGEDRAVTAAKLSDGSMYVAGKLDHYGGAAGYILKIKSNGNDAFVNRFAFSSPTSVKSIHLDGTTAYSVGLTSQDSFIEKGDNVISNSVIASVQLLDFVLDPAGGFVAAGEMDGVPVVVKFTDSFMISSSFLLSGGSSFDDGRISDIVRLPSGSFVLAGEFNFADDMKSIFLCKLDSSLNPVWMNTLSQREEASVRGLSVSSGGDILLAGTFRPTNGAPFDGYASLWSSDGSLFWQNKYGGDLSDEVWSAISAKEGGFLIVGKTKSYGSEAENGLVIRTDDYGQVDPSCGFISAANLEISNQTARKTSVTLGQSSPAPSLNPGTVKEKGALGTAELLCYNGPNITFVTKKADPFRLVLDGANFRKGYAVYIGDSSTAWAKSAYKDGTKVVLKGRNSLKSLFPKGTPVLIRLFNDDGRGCEITYTR